METTIIHPEDTSTIPNSNVLDLGILRKGSRSTGLSHRYHERALTLVPNNSQSGEIGKHPTIQVIKKSGVLSEEIQSLSDDIGFLLYPPEYLTLGEKMLRQKLDSERTQRIFTHILPQKMKTGAMADASVIVHGNVQTESQLFYHKLDEALMDAIEMNTSDSRISESIMWIFRTIYSLPLEGFEDIFQISNEREKINEWKQSLSCITMGESERYAVLQSRSVIGESGFSRDEYANLSGKIISREFARRVSSIFELFVENYVKTLWAQENKKNLEISA